VQERCDPATEIAQRLGVPEAAIVLKKRPNAFLYLPFKSMH
jgi:hypothetical protein